jgi:hypothetical protein
MNAYIETEKINQRLKGAIEIDSCIKNEMVLKLYLTLYFVL